jgi:hypothetical protein
VTRKRTAFTSSSFAPSLSLSLESELLLLLDSELLLSPVSLPSDEPDDVPSSSSLEELESSDSSLSSFLLAAFCFVGVFAGDFFGAALAGALAGALAELFGVDFADVVPASFLGAT